MIEEGSTAAFLKECEELLEEFSETIDKILNDKFKDDYECVYQVSKMLSL